MRMGMGMYCRPMPVLRLELRPRCGTCLQRFGEDQKPRRRDWQIQDLERRGNAIYQPCLECAKLVPKPESRRYRQRARKFAKELLGEKTANEQRLKEFEANKEWPADTKSLVGVYWVHDCPNCGDLMEANLGDYFECVRCRLQICIAGEVRISRHKGLGLFRREGIEAKTFPVPQDVCGMIAVDERVM
jgi:hypothetical protein